MNAARTIAWLCCVCVGVVLAHADARAQSAPIPTATAMPLTAKLRLPGPEAVEVDLTAALGGAWGEPEVRKLVAAFGIDGKPVLKRGDLTAFLHNRPLGVELTFRTADALDVPLRDYAPGALVLSNIRLYGFKRSHAAFKGDLPFGLRFGDSKDSLITKFGPPDMDSTDIASMRWDTERYALYLRPHDAGRLDLFAIQLPFVASKRPGFEKR